MTRINNSPPSVRLTAKKQRQKKNLHGSNMNENFQKFKNSIHLRKNKINSCKSNSTLRSSPSGVTTRLTAKKQQQKKNLNENLNEFKNSTALKKNKIDSCEKSNRHDISAARLSAILTTKNKKQSNMNENLPKMETSINLRKNRKNLCESNTTQKSSSSRVSVRLTNKAKDQHQKKKFNQNLKEKNSTEVTINPCHSKANKLNKTETKYVSPANGVSTLLPEKIRKRKIMMNDSPDGKRDIVLSLNCVEQKCRNGNKYKENLKPRLKQLKRNSNILKKNEVICKDNTRNKNSHKVTDKLNRGRKVCLKPANWTPSVIQKEMNKEKCSKKKALFDLKNVLENKDIRECEYSTKNSQKISNLTQVNAKTKNRKILLNRSDSFEKYGLLLPSYEKIMDNIKIMRKESKALDTYEELYGNLDITLPNDLKELINNNPTSQKSELLDCNHLCDEEMRKYFFNNLDHFKNIFEGKTYSERHTKYENFDPHFDFTYCTSTVIYTEEQKDHLLKLLEENFDPDERHTQYFFKVLLPEVCLKIFMDVYNKTKEEAVSYLDWRPVE